MTIPVTKYRPSLTGPQIIELVALLQSTPAATTSPALAPLLPYLGGFAYKAQLAGAVAAEIPTPTAAMHTTPTADTALALKSTKELKWEAAYKYLTTCEDSNQAPELVALANEHMYLHGLMTERELALFEAGETVTVPSAPDSLTI